jgi:hypothetical protein
MSRFGDSALQKNEREESVLHYIRKGKEKINDKPLYYHSYTSKNAMKNN